MLCDIYKGNKKAEMYLYVDKAKGLEDVPEALLETFGQLSLVTTLVLTPERKLARANAAKVLEEIGDKGFYLQMPPPRFAQRNDAAES